jgi:hypothetical protein
VWKLKAVRYFPRLATDYDLGWAKDARAVTVAEGGPAARPRVHAAVRELSEDHYVALHYATR